MGHQKATAVMADHPVIAGHGNTDNPSVMPQTLSTKFSIILITLQASNDHAGFEHHMSGKIPQINRVFCKG